EVGAHRSPVVVVPGAGAQFPAFGHGGKAVLQPVAPAGEAGIGGDGIGGIGVAVVAEQGHDVAAGVDAGAEVVAACHDVVVDAAHHRRPLAVRRDAESHGQHVRRLRVGAQLAAVGAAAVAVLFRVPVALVVGGAHALRQFAV